MSLDIEQHAINMYNAYRHYKRNAITFMKYDFYKSNAISIEI